MDLFLLLEINQNPVIFLDVLFFIGNCTTTTNINRCSFKFSYTHWWFFGVLLTLPVLLCVCVEKEGEEGNGCSCSSCVVCKGILIIQIFSPNYNFFILYSPADFLGMQPVCLYFNLSFSPSILSLNNSPLSCCTRSPLLRSEKFPFCITPQLELSPPL